MLSNAKRRHACRFRSLGAVGAVTMVVDNASSSQPGALGEFNQCLRILYAQAYQTQRIGGFHAYASLNGEAYYLLHS